MANTPRMQWPFPSFDADNWYRALESFALAQDASAFAAREDRNLKLTAGGEISFAAGTGVVTWTDDIEIPDPITGFLVSISADSATIAEGQYAYITIPRRPLQNITASLSIAGTIPSTDDTVVLFLRKDDRLYFREGQVLRDGESKTLFIQGGGGTGMDPLPPANIYVGDGSSTAVVRAVTGDVGISTAGLVSITNGVIEGTKINYGGAAFDFATGAAGILTAPTPSNDNDAANKLYVDTLSQRLDKLTGYHEVGGGASPLLTQDGTPITGQVLQDMAATGATINFVAVLYISGGTLTQQAGCYLYNLTTGNVVTSSQITGITATLDSVERVSLSIGAAADEINLTENVYEVRLTNSSAAPTDLVHMRGAWIEILP